MINQYSINAINKIKQDATLIKPLYGSYCFSNITTFFHNLFNNNVLTKMPHDVLGDLHNKYDNIIFFYIDGLGWNIFEKYIHHFDFFKKFHQKGVISKITSMFPSNTAPHIISCHTGLTSSESGIYEYIQYEPSVDKLISPLFFSTVDDTSRDGLLKYGIKPEDIIPNNSFYNKLRGDGINSYIFINYELNKSIINNTLYSGTSKIIPYGTFAEGCTLLLEEFKSNKKTSYYYFYVGTLDEVGHRNGPESNAYLSELNSLQYILNDLLDNLIRFNQYNSLLAVSTDHGMCHINPNEVYYINEIIPEIHNYLLNSVNGMPILPAGSTRDVFLYIKKEYLHEAKSILEAKFLGIANIVLVKDLIDDGWFGEKVTSEFNSRIADIAIIPNPGNIVWWNNLDHIIVNEYGHHGGNSNVEMEIPFLLMNI